MPQGAGLDGRQDDLARLGEHGRIGPGGIGEEVQQRLVLGGDAGRGGHGRDGLDALPLGGQEQARTVVAQGCGAIGMSDDADQLLDIGGETRLLGVIGSL